MVLSNCFYPSLIAWSWGTKWWPSCTYLGSETDNLCWAAVFLPGYGCHVPASLGASLRTNCVYLAEKAATFSFDWHVQGQANILDIKQIVKSRFDIFWYLTKPVGAFYTGEIQSMTLYTKMWGKNLVFRKCDSFVFWFCIANNWNFCNEIENLCAVT